MDDPAIVELLMRVAMDDRLATVRRCKSCKRLFIAYALPSVGLRGPDDLMCTHCEEGPSMCGICGNRFFGRSKFCSMECRREAAKISAASKRTQTVRTCAYCGKEFVRSDNRDRQNKFCSVACSNRSRRERGKRGRLFLGECEQCGATYARVVGATDQVPRFCSQACYSASSSRIRTVIITREMRAKIDMGG